MGHVVVMSGVSGAGKSTAIKEIVGSYGARHLIVSADYYFLDVDGQYHYRPEEIGAAHQLCFRNFMTALLTNQYRVIVVDNTNTTVEEISPYVLAAQSFGWTFEVVTVHVPQEALELCARRNAHNVPLQAIERQWRNLQARTLPPYYNTTNILAV